MKCLGLDVMPDGLPRRESGRAVLILLLAFSVVIFILPPMKSPDEPDHLRRAYILSQGNFLLKPESCSPNGPMCLNGRTSSGGMLDSGLNDFLNLRESWITQGRSESGMDRGIESDISWSGKQIFAVAPGTAFYFPAVYTPQALAFFAGEHFRIGVKNTYYLARIASFVSTILVLTAAFCIFNFPSSSSSLLLLPGFMIQAFSGTIDGFSTAISFLAVACFVRLLSLRKETDACGFLLMCVALFVSVTARIHLLPMLLMPFAVYFVIKNRFYLYASFVCSFASIAWIIFSMVNTVDTRNNRGASIFDVVLYYFHNPLKLFVVLYNTVSDPDLIQYYYKSFIGGSLGAGVSSAAYFGIAVLVIFSAVLSLARKEEWGESRVTRSVLVASGVGSVLMTFLALLFAWTVHPATQVQGVQGRYFIVPFALIFTGLGSWMQSSKDIKFRCVFVTALGVVSIAVAIRAIVLDYYLPWMSVPRPSAGDVAPGSLLVSGHPVDIRFGHAADGGAKSPIVRLGISLATYQKQPDGQAKLTLYDESEVLSVFDVDLKNARDNRYLYISVPPGFYRHGRLDLLDGSGGVSVWEYHARGQGESGDGKNYWQSCVVLQKANGSQEIVPGCAAP
ncbi:MAG: DUF2142 domain-containing protein [Lautropia sp.]|nr:DUF2142 domain-containing protein [Lautropia sp.]